MKDRIPNQLDSWIEGRHFAIHRGTRWTKVDEYLSNGQLTARWFVDESTGEVREAESAARPKAYMATPTTTQFALGVIARAQRLDTDVLDYLTPDTYAGDGAEIQLHTRGGEISIVSVCTSSGKRTGCRGVYTPEEAEALSKALAAYARVAREERRLRDPPTRAA